MWDCVQLKRTCSGNDLHTQASGKVTDKSECAIFLGKKWPMTTGIQRVWSGIKGWGSQAENERENVSQVRMIWIRELQAARKGDNWARICSLPPYRDPAKALTGLLKMRKRRKRNKTKRKTPRHHQPGPKAKMGRLERVARPVAAVGSWPTPRQPFDLGWVIWYLWTSSS